MEQRKFQRFSDNSHVLFSSDTVKSFGVEFIRIAPGSPQRLQDYLGRRRLRRRLTHAAYRRLASTPLIGRLSGDRLTARKHSAV